MTESSENSHWNLKSWVETANDPSNGFPLQSLPFCAFVSPEWVDRQAHIGVGIGEFILDLHSLSASGHLAVLGDEVTAACREPQLNALISLGDQGPLRLALSIALAADGTFRHEVEPHLISQREVQFRLPIAVGDYTDFYASIHHATRVGKLFRPGQPLLPNYKWLPIGYHGRASSLVVSGTPICRPQGQIKLADQDTPLFAPTQQLDYELELAAYIGIGNPLGEPIPRDGIPTRSLPAENHIFGYSLLNDWSARDIQSWEYQPLGPFLGKSFATSLSPWVVTPEALAPYRVSLAPRAEGDPDLLPYLAEPDWMKRDSGLDIQLEARLSTAKMRESSIAPIFLSSSNARDLYWSFGQMIAHHTSNGCNLRTGDLIASGTVSGPHPGSEGCLLELTQRGNAPLTLPNGEIRSFLEDGDEVILSGSCHGEGLPKITLGECRGIILPAHPARPHQSEPE
jgi:fumarylacetoacetase